MISIQLQAGDRWEIEGSTYYFEQAMGSGFLLFRSEHTGGPYQVMLDTGGLVSPTMDWFVTQFSEGKVRRLKLLEGRSETHNIALQREDDFDALVAKDSRALLRQVVLRSYDRQHDLSLSDRALKAFLAKLWSEKARQLADHKPPSPSSLRRWIRDRGETGYRPLKIMINMSGTAPRKKRLPAPVHRRMHAEAIAYWSDHSKNIQECYDSLRSNFNRINRYVNARGWKRVHCPSKETFRLYVHSLECHDTVAAKYGIAEADKRFKANGLGLAAHRPLLLAAMDHTLLDVHLVLDVDELRYLGRPWLTVILDINSRCLVGWVLSFEPPSLYSVMECIKRANLPKSEMLNLYPECPDLVGIFGKFDEIVVDNGLEFVGTSFESAMIDIGTSVRIAPRRKPTHKAPIERFFGTLNELLNKRLPGGSFSIAQKKAWELDPQKDAVLTLEQAEQFLSLAIGVYHQEVHSTLGETPVSVWARGVKKQGGVPVIGDVSQLEKMAGAEVRRCLSRSGISLFDLSYHDPAITGPLLEDLAASQPMRKRRQGSATANVKVKYNPANLGSLHVWNPKRGIYQTLPCTSPDYAQGLSKWQHDKLQEWAREEQGLTEKERVERRHALRQILRDGASPQTRKRIDRKEARLLASPKIQSLAGGQLRVAYAEPRHDGLAPIIDQRPLAPDRTDSHRKPVRPQRGRRKPLNKASTKPEILTPSNQTWTVGNSENDGWEELK